MSDQIRPSKATRDAESREATKAAAPDRPPTSDEDAAAERAGRLDERVVEHEQEMLERGANQRGEGRI